MLRAAAQFGQSSHHPHFAFRLTSTITDLSYSNSSNTAEKKSMTSLPVFQVMKSHWCPRGAGCASLSDNLETIHESKWKINWWQISNSNNVLDWRHRVDAKEKTREAFNDAALQSQFSSSLLLSVKLQGGWLKKKWAWCHLGRVHCRV